MRTKNRAYTGKSVSEALILESVNPQYNKRVIIELQESQNMLCTNIILNVKTKTNVLNLYFSGNSINNLWSYYVLTDARMRASEKYLPVQK